MGCEPGSHLQQRVAWQPVALLALTCLFCPTGYSSGCKVFYLFSLFSLSRMHLDP
jgi:hypothetical protein